MKIFVAGASGFVGSSLVRLLLQRGAELKLLVRPTSNLVPRAGSPFRGFGERPGDVGNGATRARTGRRGLRSHNASCGQGQRQPFRIFGGVVLGAQIHPSFAREANSSGISHPSSIQRSAVKPQSNALKHRRL